MIRKEYKSSDGSGQLFSGEPPWSSDKSSSWSFSDDSINYGVSDSGDHIYIQYGQKTSTWASNRFWIYSVELSNEVVNKDKSISVDVKITPKLWNTIDVTPGAGVSVNYDISIAGKSVWTYSGNTHDEISFGEQSSYTINITVPPESCSSETAVKINVYYPNGEYEDNYTYVGLFLCNDNKAVKEDDGFKPWALRKSGIFRTLNVPQGHFYIRKPDWKDISINISKGKEEGHNRIRKSSRWLGQSKAGI